MAIQNSISVGEKRMVSNSLAIEEATIIASPILPLLKYFSFSPSKMLLVLLSQNITCIKTNLNKIMSTLLSFLGLINPILAAGRDEKGLQRWAEHWDPGRELRRGRRPWQDSCSFNTFQADWWWVQLLCQRPVSRSEFQSLGFFSWKSNGQWS